MPLTYPPATVTKTGTMDQQYDQKGNAHVFRPRTLSEPTGTMTAISGTLYAVYMGKLNQAQAFTFASFVFSTAGTGTQTAEIGLFSSPNPPIRGAAAQTLTCLAVSNVSSLTSTLSSPAKNSSTFSGTTVPINTHLWVGVRIAMLTTQPAFLGYGADWGDGQILTLAASGVITASNTYAMAIPTAAVASTAQCPRFLLTID